MVINENDLTEQTKMKSQSEYITIDSKDHLHPLKSEIPKQSVILLLLWYIFSAFTLFLNKYIVKNISGDYILLGCIQMAMVTLLGYFQMYYPLRMFQKVDRPSKPVNFYKHMLVVGTLRFLTVLLGIIALEFIEVSFTETIKSSAPAFTVLISKIVLGEVTGFYVKLSLLPVMGGLALCSSNELSFNLIGFLSALGTNISECLQNVFSKKLVSGKNNKYSPGEMQFFTGLASLVAQIPIILWYVGIEKIMSTSGKFFGFCILNGVFFHFQTVTNFALLDHISTVTHSVANTAKRALLIVLSVILFGNSITFLSGLGSIIVLLGVISYNKALVIDRTEKKKECYNKNELKQPFMSQY